MSTASRTRVLGLALIVVGLANAGCVVLPAAPAAAPAERPAALLDAFAYEPLPARLTGDETIRRTERYAVRRVEFPSTANVAGEHGLTIDYFQLARPGAAPLVVVLPILGGDNEVANLFARHFADSGLSAAIIHRQERYKDADDLEEMNDVFRQIVLDHRQALDWLEDQPGVDPERIGLFGISAGSIKAALVAAVDPRIRASVLGLAGGDLAWILSRSKDGGITKMRERIMAEHGVTRDELYDAIAAEFRHDPLTLAPYIDPRRTLLILAVFDAVVPFNTGLALRRAMGNPTTILLPTGHYTAVLYLPFVQWSATRFLRRQLQAADAAGGIER